MFSNQDLHDDPIVITGIAARLPGEDSSVEGFWDMVVNGRTGHGKVPAGRYNADAYYHPDVNRAGAINTTSGYFLKEDPAYFDAPFFNMTVTEAAGMDPMQRMMLEVAYESLENAGTPVHKIAKTRTACFVGCFTKDWEQVSSRDIYDTNLYQSTGCGQSMLSNRVSWFYDLSGPSMTIDTACSSSLCALHLACQSIRSGESDQALVGGTNMVLHPDFSRALTAMRFLSPDGKCHSFEAKANGYARGEGISVLLIKRLSKALADGDTIRSVIRATGSNQDGKSPGITMPESRAQADLIRQCYDTAGLTFDDTCLFEAHGTGTPVGDPAELAALGLTFGTTRDMTNPLYVSSAKTNVGHQEGNAGLTGVIRATLAVEKGLIPPLAEFEKPSPLLHLDAWKIALPAKAMPWPNAKVRRASINSFGYGGANAHVILDDAFSYLQERGLLGRHQTLPLPQLSNSSDSDSGFSSEDVSTIEPGYDHPYIASQSAQLISFSALDQAALQRTFGRHAGFVQKRLDGSKQLDSMGSFDLKTFLGDYSYTLNHRRTSLDHRSFVVANNITTLLAQLRAGPKSNKVGKNDNIAFVFTGQGAQYAEMGKDLLRHEVFHDSLMRSQSTLASLGCIWHLTEELLKPEQDSQINMPEFSQPLCTALQLAQVDLLASWGILPKSVVGHSSGEIAAAYACGALSHEDAMTIAYHRGRFSADVTRRMPDRKGGMLAVGLSQEAAQSYLETVRPSSVVVACVNSPESITLSGDLDELAALEQRLQADSVFARKLKVQTAYHSPHMQVIADDYRAAMTGVQPKTSPSEVRMFSSVTGAVVPPKDLTADYWVANMLQTVEFSEGLHALLTYSDNTRRRRRPAVQYAAILEVGPHEALKGPIKQILGKEDAKLVANTSYVSIMHRSHSADTTALEAMGQLWCRGCHVDFQAINGQSHASTSLTDLPYYPWNHSKMMWHESQLEKNRRHLKEPRTDLLGYLEETSDPLEPVYRNLVRTVELPWLADHKIHTAILFPGASMVVMALEAAQRLAVSGKKVKGYTFRDVSFPRALVVPADGSKVEVLMTVKPHRIGTRADTAPWYDFRLLSRGEANARQEHCAGLFSIVYENGHSEVDAGSEAARDWAQKTQTFQDKKQSLSTRITRKIFYKKSHAMGLQYGPSFQGIEECTTGQGECHTVVAIPDTKAVMPHQYEHNHLIHPTTLDSIFQSLLGTMFASKVTETFVPTAINNMFIASDLPTGAAAKFIGYAHGAARGTREQVGHIVMSDEQWSGPKVVVDGFESMALSMMTAGSPQDDAASRRRCTTVQWSEDLRYSAPVAADTALVTSEDDQAYQRAVIATMARAIDELDGERRLSQHMQKYIQWAKAAIEEAGHQPSGSTHGDHDLLPASLEALPDRIVDLARRGKSTEGAVDEQLLTDVRSWALRHTDFAQLDSWVAAMFHNLPSMTVLLVGDNTTTSAAAHVARQWAEQAGRTDGFQKCTVAELDDAALQTTKQSLLADKLFVQYKSVDFSKPAAEQDLDTRGYDLVLLSSTSVFHSKRPDAMAKSLQAWLRPSGRLIVCGKQQVSLPLGLLAGLNAEWFASNISVDAGADGEDIDLKVQLEQSGFSIQDSHASPQQAAFVVASTNPSPQVLLHQDDIVFLNSPSPIESATQLQQNLTECFAKAGLDCESTTPSQGLDVSGRTIVSLIELSEQYIKNMTAKDLAYIKQMVAQASRVLWLTRAAQPLEEVALEQTLTTGLLRTIRSEVPQTINVHLDIACSTDITAPHVAGLVRDVLFKELLEAAARPTHDRELAEKDGRIFVPRLVWNKAFDDELNMPLKKTAAPREAPLVQSGRPLKCVIGKPGHLDSLYWVDDDETRAPIGPDEVDIKASAMSMNFVDIMAAMGQIPTSTVGAEVAGTVIRVGSAVSHLKAGDRVIAAKTNSFRTLVRENVELVEKIPDDMDFAVAASIPLIFTTAYNGLVDIAQLQKGESILIHAAAGGLGQAAIQIAQWIGAEIYVTVGTNAKKDLIMKHYNIPEHRIFSSRDVTFAPAVMHATGGKGVDVILNSLAGEALRATWNCIADFGRFIEVGKKDIVGNSGLDMAPFMRQVTFASVNLEHLKNANRAKYGQVQRKVFELVRAGAFGQVYPIVQFGFGELEKAFRIMQTGKHSGKLVFCVNEDDQVPVLPRKPEQVSLDPAATYVVCGGLGGIGRSIARMMFDRGAEHIVFLSRSGASTATARSFLDQMAALGKRAESRKCDTTDPTQVAAFTQLCDEQQWKVKGLVQSAMVLQDSTLENMTFQDWSSVTRAKVDGSWNLHESLPKDMDFFIMLSSVSGILGHPGQANYCAANTYQDALAHHRHSKGLAATAIDLGVVSDVGYFSENPEQFEKFDHLASLHVNEQDLHALMSASMMGKTSDGQPVPAQIVVGFGKALLTDPRMGSVWSKDLKFSHAHNGSNAVSEVAENDVLRDRIAAAATLKEAAVEIQEALIGKLSKALMTDAADIDPAKPLHNYGVDSLVAVEIRNWTFRDLKSDVTVFDILSPLSIALLALKIATKCTFVPADVLEEGLEEANRDLGSSS